MAGISRVLASRKKIQKSPINLVFLLDHQGVQQEIINLPTQNRWPARTAKYRGAHANEDSKSSGVYNKTATIFGKKISF